MGQTTLLLAVSTLVSQEMVDDTLKESGFVVTTIRVLSPTRKSDPCFVE